MLTGGIAGAGVELGDLSGGARAAPGPRSSKRLDDLRGSAHFGWELGKTPSKFVSCPAAR